jgi:GMP synthase (glutamine-hydrolysing)
MCQALGGKVEGSGQREFGHTSIEVTRSEGIFGGIEGRTVVWMSHGDKVTRLPVGFVTCASSDTCEHAAVADPARSFYAVQFHPEVAHTVRGKEVLANFVLDVCRLPGDWRAENIVEREVRKVREQCGEHGEVILGLSGGVDSSVAAMIVHRAIGDRLHCIFVDNGLLRKGERQVVEHAFRDHIGLDLTTVDARQRFVSKLAGVMDPEQKRKIIGH